MHVTLKKCMPCDITYLNVGGARRGGKSTIAEHFARNEYKSYILIDFSKIIGS